MSSEDEDPATESLTPEETPSDRMARWLRFLEEKVWPDIPPEVRGKRITKEEKEEILGYGPDGY
jgi:antitoxin VapB